MRVNIFVLLSLLWAPTKAFVIYNNGSNSAEEANLFSRIPTKTGGFLGATGGSQILMTRRIITRKVTPVVHGTNYTTSSIYSSKGLPGGTNQSHQGSSKSQTLDRYNTSLNRDPRSGNSWSSSRTIIIHNANTPPTTTYRSSLIDDGLGMSEKISRGRSHDDYTDENGDELFLAPQTNTLPPERITMTKKAQGEREERSSFSGSDFTDHNSETTTTTKTAPTTPRSTGSSKGLAKNVATEATWHPTPAYTETTTTPTPTTTVTTTTVTVPSTAQPVKDAVPLTQTKLTYANPTVTPIDSITGLPSFPPHNCCNTNSNPTTIYYPTYYYQNYYYPVYYGYGHEPEPATSKFTKTVN